MEERCYRNGVGASVAELRWGEVGWGRVEVSRRRGMGEWGKEGDGVEAKLKLLSELPLRQKQALAFLNKP